MINLYDLESEVARRVVRFVAAAEDARRVREASPAGGRRPWLANRLSAVKTSWEAAARRLGSAGRRAPAPLACCPA